LTKETEPAFAIPNSKIPLAPFKKIVFEPAITFSNFFLDLSPTSIPHHPAGIPSWHQSFLLELRP